MKWMFEDRVQINSKIYPMRLIERVDYYVLAHRLRIGGPRFALTEAHVAHWLYWEIEPTLRGRILVDTRLGTKSYYSMVIRRLADRQCIPIRISSNFEYVTYEDKKLVDALIPGLRERRPHELRQDSALHTIERDGGGEVWEEGGVSIARDALEAWARLTGYLDKISRGKFARKWGREIVREYNMPSYRAHRAKLDNAARTPLECYASGQQATYGALSG